MEKPTFVVRTDRQHNKKNRQYFERRVLLFPEYYQDLWAEHRTWSSAIRDASIQ